MGYGSESEPGENNIFVVRRTRLVKKFQSSKTPQFKIFGTCGLPSENSEKSSKIPKSWRGVLALGLRSPAKFQNSSVKEFGNFGMSHNYFFGPPHSNPNPIHPFHDFGILELFSEISRGRPQVPKFLI